MYCSHCGKEISDIAAICPACGTSVNSNAKTVEADKSSFWFGLLSFFFPIVGLILFLVWKDNLPKRARSAGIGAIIGVVAGIVLSILLTVLVTAFGIVIAESIANTGYYM